VLCSYFKTDAAGQDKVLGYGIGGAAVMRFVLILLGSAAVEQFRPILLVFAATLLYASYSLLTGGGEEEEEDMANNWIVNSCRKVISVSDTYDGDNFFTMANGVSEPSPLSSFHPPRQARARRVLNG
jgi:predicted tellurium resistance membrane protein TerC